MNQLETIAAEIFKRFGVDFATARRAVGWTNATWLAGGFALRLSTKPGNDKIRREVQLASHLPEQVGYPINVATGVTEGLEWSLSKEVPGKTLSEAWPDLTWSERSTAIRQIWEIAEAVHAVNLADVDHLVRRRAWYNSNDSEEAAASMARLLARGLFTLEQGKTLEAILDRFWQVLPTAPLVLCHGDITPDNMMWHKGRVVSLMDFEWSVIAPVQLDVNSILKLVFGPEVGQTATTEDDRAGLRQLQQTAVDLVKPALTQDGGIDLLLGYALLHEQCRLEGWLANADDLSRVQQWSPYRWMLLLADGQGGFFEPVVAAANSR